RDPERVKSDSPDADGKDGSAVIRVGKNGNYDNIEAPVMDATNNLSDEVYQDDPNLVAIVGRQLLADKYFPLLNKQQENSESLVAAILIIQKRISNMPAERVRYFPANAVLVTTLDYISLYFLDESHRSSIDVNQKNDLAATYE
ncbi:P2 family phage major capsid protein, partial [Salmonella enterica]|uniref:P2 family phage major capsid protein n=1 Tax=Salmonella enterica TaxID=28901 RepID=UPI000A6A4CC6